MYFGSDAKYAWQSCWTPEASVNKARLSSVRREGAVNVTLWNSNFTDSRASVRPWQDQQMTCIDPEGGLETEKLGCFTES